MKNKWVLMFLGAVFMAVSANTDALAVGKCDGADIANGPFLYTALGATQATFNGSGGAPVSTSFNITAPSVDSRQQSELPDLFPGEGQVPCAATAYATIGALEIQKVGDATGSPIDPVGIDPSSTLGLSIAGAFALTPNSKLFGIGETANIAVEVSNPNLSAADYGDYEIKLAAQAPGYGIGVGSGLQFSLSLRASTATDTTPPVVTVTKPASDEILGVIPVEIQAYDPVTLPASGLAAMSATVSSAGGAVSNLSIPLSLNQTLPATAGVTVTGTGSFTPTGGAVGTGPGTTDTQAFTSSSRSGIGSYTINAQTQDGAGNTGYGSKSFKVNYSVAFTKESSTRPCQSGGNDTCTGQFQFSVNRSNVISDGAFMYDHTVVVKLVRTSDNTEMATHSYGTTSILSVVQIDSSPIYQTNFKRSTLTGAPTGPASYRAEVYFLDVDNTLVLQGTSANVTF
ncbi:MAG: hypothetical protein PHR66_09525 [Desulfuromonadaceae bacterium]|nr:hypothetical protein [Desulfuromonadaceae bacterium]